MKTPQRLIIITFSLFLMAACGTTSPTVSKLKQHPPAGTPVKPGEILNVWIDSNNLESPVHQWKLSRNGEIIIEEGGGRLFSFSPNQPGNYEVALDVIDGGETILSASNSIIVAKPSAVDAVAEALPSPSPTSTSVVVPPTSTSTPGATTERVLTVIPTATLPVSGTPVVFSRADEFVLPASTSTSTLEALPTPTDAVPVPFPFEAVVVSTSGLNLRSGPGLAYAPPIDVLAKDAVLTVVGRTDNSEWLKISTDNSNIEGWVSAAPSLLQFDGDINSVPLVAETPPPPPPTPVLLPPPPPPKYLPVPYQPSFWCAFPTFSCSGCYSVHVSCSSRYR